MKIEYLVYALLAGILIWRIILPSMGLGSEKTSTNDEALATAPAGTSMADRGFEWFKSNLMIVLLVLVGGGVVLWGFYSPVRFSDAAKWREYWFSLVVLWIVLSVIIALNAKTLGETAKTLQKILACTVAAILVVILVGMWMEGEKSPPQQAQQSCLPYSSMDVRGCVVTENPLILTTKESTTTGEFEFCYLKPEHGSLVVKEIGINTFEFKSTGGAFPIEYKMIKRISLVDGKCPTRF